MYIKYVAYNLLKTNYQLLHKFVTQLHQERNIPKILIYKDIVFHFFKWDTWLLDYFYMRFFDKKTDIQQHTTIWDLYRFHKKYNGKEYIIFRDKLQFRKRFSHYFTYPYFELSSSKELETLRAWLISNGFRQIVAKKPLSSGGRAVKILNIEYADGGLLIDGENTNRYFLHLFKKGYKLFESFIEQDSNLTRIAPKSINTIRIVTFLNPKKEIEIWATVIRFGFDKSLDNFSMGGLCASIDINSGIINSLARIKDPFSTQMYDKHPVTGEAITGVKIPYWDEIITMIKKAALEVPTVRSVGWDIAITKDGPTLIEGNDNWGKTIVELVTGKGLNVKIQPLISQGT